MELHKKSCKTVITHLGILKTDKRFFVSLNKVQIVKMSEWKTQTYHDAETLFFLSSEELMKWLYLLIFLIRDHWRVY